MTNGEIDSQAFHEAELRSERTRVNALLRVFAGLLGLVLIRGAVSLAEGRRSVVWPFGVLLAMTAVYEVVWLRFVNRSIQSNRTVSGNAWTLNSLIESLVPTVALFLEIHTSFVSPDSALSSPVVLTYLLFIILSALHLNPGLSRLTGVFSMAGYLAVSIYVFVTFPEESASDEPVALRHGLFLFRPSAPGRICYRCGCPPDPYTRTSGSPRGGEPRPDCPIGARSRHCTVDSAGVTPEDASAKCVASILPGGINPPMKPGGDYFDWQQLADGRAAITVADVSGHGIGPALCMASCRAYARACLAAGMDLRSFLLRMNQLLDGDLPLSKFVTMVVGLLDPEEETLHLISAGHGPLFFYSSKEDKVCILDAQGPAAGAIAAV